MFDGLAEVVRQRVLGVDEITEFNILIGRHYQTGRVYLLRGYAGISEPIASQDLSNAVAVRAKGAEEG